MAQNFGIGAADLFKDVGQIRQLVGGATIVD
jgi:hypothetical protein